MNSFDWGNILVLLVLISVLGFFLSRRPSQERKKHFVVLARMTSGFVHAMGPEVRTLARRAEAQRYLGECLEAFLCFLENDSRLITKEAVLLLDDLLLLYEGRLCFGGPPKEEIKRRIKILVTCL